jgi:hypothetical protein
MRKMGISIITNNHYLTTVWVMVFNATFNNISAIMFFRAHIYHALNEYMRKNIIAEILLKVALNTITHTVVK